MSAFRLALIILRRMFFYAMFVSFGIAFLLYVSHGMFRFSKRVHEARHQLQMIDADVIAPKGSSVEHLRRLLKLELFEEPALIPAQLYTTLSTDKPDGLKLTPVLFWAHDRGVPVIAVDPKIQDILGHMLPEVFQISQDGLIAGREAAERLGLKVGGEIDVETRFGHTVETQAKRKLKVQFISDLGIWDGALLSSFDGAKLALKEVKFKPEQIWKDQILSYIFVTGEEKWLGETKQLIDKRTVAVDLRLRDEIPGLLKLSGVDEKLEFEVLLFAGIAALISFFAFLSIWYPLLNRMTRNLKRSGYSSSRIAGTFTWLAVFLLTIAALLAYVATYLNPIL